MTHQSVESWDGASLYYQYIKDISKYPLLKKDEEIDESSEFEIDTEKQGGWSPCWNVKEYGKESPGIVTECGAAWRFWE